jgi:type I restriction enzyme, S subunit
VWNRSDGTMVIQKALHRVRPSVGISPWYLAICLANDADTGRLVKYFTGSTIKHFTGESLRSYVIALPPVNEQQRLLEKVEKRLSLVAELSSQTTAGLKRTNRLRQSILKRAFEGKLVPQDPNDEPASVLLERIKASRNGEMIQAKLI